MLDGMGLIAAAECDHLTPAGGHQPEPPVHAVEDADLDAAISVGVAICGRSNVQLWRESPFAEVSADMRCAQCHELAGPAG